MRVAWLAVWVSACVVVDVEPHEPSPSPEAPAVSPPAAGAEAPAPAKDAPSTAACDAAWRELEQASLAANAGDGAGPVVIATNRAAEACEGVDAVRVVRARALGDAAAAKKADVRPALRASGYIPSDEAPSE